jgi:hypothetical protein
MNETIAARREPPITKVINFSALIEMIPALKIPGTKAGKDLTRVPTVTLTVVSRIIMMAIQITMVRFKFPKKGRKQYFSRNRPKPPMMMIDKSKETHWFKPHSTASWKQIYPLTMYIAPWAKFRMPIMLKSKAKPNATNIYIDDSIRALITVIRVSCIQTFFFWPLRGVVNNKKQGRAVPPPDRVKNK